MIGSLSNFVNTLDEGVNENKCKYEHDDKNVKHAELNAKIATTFLNTQTLKMI